MYNAAPTAVLIAAAVRKKYVRVFKRQGAISPQSAIKPEDFGLNRRLIFNSLLRQGILSAAAKDHFFLNETKEQEVLKSHKEMAVIIMSLLLIALILVLLLVNRR